VGGSFKIQATCLSALLTDWTMDAWYHLSIA
jgi:hypothetical protein